MKYKSSVFVDEGILNDSVADFEFMTVCITRLKMKGDGKESPFRRVTQVWDGKGNLILEIDPCGIAEVEKTDGK